MKTFNILYLLLIVSLIAVSVLFISCSDNSLSPEQIQSSVNEYFSSIPDWEIGEPPKGEDIYINSITVDGPDLTASDFDSAPIVDYECPVFDRNMATTITNFKSVGTNEGRIWPGAIIQGNSLKTGDIRLIETSGKRADITLTTNIPLEVGSKTITPNSVTAQQAISDFMVAAGTMPEGSQAGAGVTLTRIEEATTYNQAMSQMGVSVGFRDIKTDVGLSGSLDVSNQRSSHEHTVVAQYVQEKFKVRIADDLISSPADFFTDDFTSEDLETLERNGEIGPNNIPLYIEEVTYGRILLFSKTSKRVEDAESLSAALSASMSDYAEGGGGLSDKQKDIFKNSTNRIYSAGGSESGANAAVANLDWSKFFVETTASEAVPISFVARTINGKKLVGMVNHDSHEYRGNCTMIDISEPINPPVVKSYDITVEWTETGYTSYCNISNCAAGMVVFSPFRDVILNILNSYQTKFTTYPGEDGYFEVMSQLTADPPNSTGSLYNVSSLREGTRTHRNTLENWWGSVTTTYTITKKTNYY